MLINELRSTYSTADETILNSINNLAAYKDLTMKDIELVLKLKDVDKKETVRIEVVDTAKQFMSIKDIRDTFFPDHNTLHKSREIMKAFERETLRADSKVDKVALIRNGQDCWGFTLALLWFMKYQTQLEDEIRRNSVEKFNAEKFKSLLFFTI